MLLHGGPTAVPRVFHGCVLYINNMDFALDEKREFTADNQPWLTDPVKEALVSKSAELKQYNRLVRLYGAESPVLAAFQQQHPLPRHRHDSINKVLETRHSMTIENKLLSFFVFMFSVFCAFQLTLIAIIRFDLEPHSLEWFSHEVFFNYAYLGILLLGKCLTYLFMLTFFFRVYVGVKLFKDTVTTNVLLKLINVQFMGFLSSSLITAGIVAVDLLLKKLLMQLEIINDYPLDATIASVNQWTSYVDWVFYCTVAVGVVLSTTRKLVRAVL